ncbi:hypothetical protein OS493_031749 [Desmophyllum pertusum]|uniref:Uncharacterized protein n=1 Tax=Desmophyllum pertusum TaxID=174260 RepID=A0A9X0CVA0_9CNID|nr:hypothetical protein OS493_031749 [Desmophyllum pertusum]
MNSLLEPSEEETTNSLKPTYGKYLTDNSQKSHYDKWHELSVFSLLFYILESKPETAEKAENTAVTWEKNRDPLFEETSLISLIIKDLFGGWNPFEYYRFISSAVRMLVQGQNFLLSTHSMRSWFIVVEAKTMKEEQFQDKPAGTPYENLLRTARKTVDKKVVIIVCNDKGNVSHNDEDVITNRIKQLLDYEAAAKSMEHDAHLINPEEFTLLLETRLRHGRISYADEDVKQRLDGWTISEYLAKNLLKDWKSTAEAELLIYGENKTGVINKVDVRAVKEDSKITHVD